PLPSATLMTFGNPDNQITFTAGTTPNEVTIVLAKTAPVTLSQAVSRNYTITPSSVTAFTSTLRLRYLDTELNGNVEASLNFRRNTAGIWNPIIPTTRDAVNNWIESTAVTAFSQWALSSLSPTASNGT